MYKRYHVKVNACKERHNDASEANKKEMITALIKNLGKHPTREVTQHQIEMLQSEVKSMPESGRRDFDGYLTQVAKARVDLLKSIAKCNRMHMLKKECITDSMSGTKRTFGDVEEEERSSDFDRERDQERNRDRIRELSKCNHCNKNHPPPCHLLSHPDCNPDAGIPFAESEKGKEWLKKGHYCVSNFQRLDGSVWNNPNPKPQYSNHNRQQNHHSSRHNGQRGNNDNNRNFHRGGRRF